MTPQTEHVVNPKGAGTILCKVCDGCFVVRNGKGHKGGETFATNPYDAAHPKRRSLVEVVERA